MGSDPPPPTKFENDIPDFWRFISFIKVDFDLSEFKVPYFLYWFLLIGILYPIKLS